MCRLFKAPTILYEKNNKIQNKQTNKTKKKSAFVLIITPIPIGDPSLLSLSRVYQLILVLPASVGQFDARPTGTRKLRVRSHRVGYILSWRLIIKKILRLFSPFRRFKKGNCQFLARECAQYWLTA